MKPAATREAATPTIVFGAFDRHNFGDLLFPHVVAALLEEKDLVFAGLAQRDLRGFGGHRVRALAALAAARSACPVNIIHAGGELLTCDDWQAAVMLLPPEQAQAVIARFDARPQERSAWARSQLGLAALAPYTVSRSLFPGARRVVYNAVGGVDLDQCEPAMRAEVLANLRTADAVGVRDRQTHALLAAAGVAATVLPDPAVMVAELFGTAIRERARHGELAQVRAAFPDGYIAVQFSADFGDDDILAPLAAQLDRVAASSGHGVVFFRAGAAPWHDDLACYRRAAARMRGAAPRIFSSLNLWDICALVAGSRAYLGSSLHGRIVAMAFALPRVNLRHPAQAGRRIKQAAFAATWEQEGMPDAVEVSGIAPGLRLAMAADPALLRRIAGELAALYRAEFGRLCAGI